MPAGPHIRVQQGAFDLGAELASLQDRAGSGCGGIGSFLGVVRADAEGRLAALVLEHYPGMTEAALTEIADEAMRRFSLLACTIVHRVGRLQVGAPIVFVAAAAPHRGDALAATTLVIDFLKTRAPFWKCEEMTDGTRSWVEARDADEATANAWQ